jgi:hypothetical protein
MQGCWLRCQSRGSVSSGKFRQHAADVRHHCERELQAQHEESLLDPVTTADPMSMH